MASADAITVTLQVTVSSSNYTPGTFSLTQSIDQNSVGGAQNVQTINTSASEALTKGDATNGFLVLRNLDGTNYLNYGSSNAMRLKLKAGEGAVVRVSSSGTIYAQANTGSCKLFTWFIND